MKLRIGKRAQQQADRMEDWWVANRPGAPTLFTDELEETFQLMCEAHEVGISWPTKRRPALRRILMPRTQNHIYFRVDENTQTVHVLSIWGAPRGRTPKL